MVAGLLSRVWRAVHREAGRWEGTDRGDDLVELAREGLGLWTGAPPVEGDGRVHLSASAVREAFVGALRALTLIAEEAEGETRVTLADLGFECAAVLWTFRERDTFVCGRCLATYRPTGLLRCPRCAEVAD
jgi:hypothetical protein